MISGKTVPLKYGVASRFMWMTNCARLLRRGPESSTKVVKSFHRYVQSDFANCAGPASVKFESLQGTSSMASAMYVTEVSRIFKACKD